MTAEKRRFDNIDIARGFAMLVIIEWHTIGIHTSWTDGWVMPIFFIIMGIFYKQEESFQAMAIKKINTIVVPMLIFSTPMFFISLYEKGVVPTIMKLLNPYGMLHGVSWFLLCTLWCYTINYLLHKYIRNQAWLLLIMLALSAFSFYISTFEYHGHRLVLPLFCSTALTALGYLAIGEFAKIIFIYRGGYSTIFIFAGFCVFIFMPSGMQDNLWNQYQDCWLKLMFVGALESLAIIHICHIIPKVLGIIGKLSILILLLHPYIVMLLAPLSLNMWLSYSIISISTIILSYLLYKHTPQLCGFKPLI